MLRCAQHDMRGGEMKVDKVLHKSLMFSLKKDIKQFRSPLASATQLLYTTHVQTNRVLFLLNREGGRDNDLLQARSGKTSQHVILSEAKNPRLCEKKFLWPVEPLLECHFERTERISHSLSVPGEGSDQFARRILRFAQNDMRGGRIKLDRLLRKINRHLMFLSPSVTRPMRAICPGRRCAGSGTRRR